MKGAQKVANEIYNRVTIKKNICSSFESVRQQFSRSDWEENLFLDILPPPEEIKTSQILDWQIKNWGVDSGARHLQVNYDEESTLQASFITHWDIPIGVFRKLISDNPGLDIFISTASIDSSFAGWICKLAGMETYEEDFFYEINFIFEDNDIFAEVAGGSRFIELASQFKYAAHSWAFIDAP
jgi:hypothetical protein